jgi:RsiW-degrading membrane proteinase PrsW (M82 family)
MSNWYEEEVKRSDNKVMFKMWFISYVLTFAWFLYKDSSNWVFDSFISIPTSFFMLIVFSAIYQAIIEPILKWISK